MTETNVSHSGAVKLLRRNLGPRCRAKRVDSAGVRGIQLLDGSGRVLLQTFQTTDASEALKMFLGTLKGRA